MQDRKLELECRLELGLGCQYLYIVKIHACATSKKAITAPRVNWRSLVSLLLPQSPSKTIPWNELSIQLWVLFTGFFQPWNELFIQLWVFKFFITGLNNYFMICIYTVNPPCHRIISLTTLLLPGCWLAGWLTGSLSPSQVRPLGWQLQGFSVVFFPLKTSF